MRITPGILSVWDSGLEDSYEYLRSLSLFLPLSLAGETCVWWPRLVAVGVIYRGLWEAPPSNSTK